MSTHTRRPGRGVDLLAVFSIAFGTLATLAALSLIFALPALVLSFIGFVTGVSARDRVCLTGVALSLFAFLVGSAVIAAVFYRMFVLGIDPPQLLH